VLVKKLLTVAPVGSYRACALSHSSWWLGTGSPVDGGGAGRGKKKGRPGWGVLRRGRTGVRICLLSGPWIGLLRGGIESGLRPWVSLWCPRPRPR